MNGPGHGPGHGPVEGPPTGRRTRLTVAIWTAMAAFVLFSAAVLTFAVKLAGE